MTDLRVQTLTISTAPLGPLNPLPPLFATADTHQVTDTAGLDSEMIRNIGYGRVTSVLPYLLQDGYGRIRSDVDHPVIVLENDLLTATFLPGLGGRLWSLVDRRSGRELLHRNPVVQPANLALRGAWVAGGVEWNVGTIGHSPTTCEPLHAARVDLPDGTPMVRMYEFERLREVVFQIDAWLPDGSPVLFVHVRITNPASAPVPTYWWSNTAVAQAPDVRVLAPADSAWHFGQHRRLGRVPIPYGGRLDHSYPARAREAADHFFALDDESPWISAVDGAGLGLFQASTRQLRGRKLFVWGTSRGGTNWQDWLGDADARYFEIQAGLARTQLEHVPLEARAAVSWVEAYGPIAVDPVSAHSPNWHEAVRATGAAVRELAPTTLLDDALTTALAAADTAPTTVLHVGSGWGALDSRLRAACSEPRLALTGTPFPDDTLGPAQQPWVDLLRTGGMNAEDPGQAPPSYQVSRRWVPFLEAGNGWAEALHLGVVRAHRGDQDGARRAWAVSLSRQPSAWAHRNLGALARSTGDRELAVREYTSALALQPHLVPLTLELIGVLLDSGHPDRVLEIVDAQPARSRDHGRLRWAEARAATLVGDLDRAARIIDGDLVLADLREGEQALDGLWFGVEVLRRARARGVDVSDELLAEVRATAVVPPRLDFRMFPVADSGVS